jgi:ankyrin repeat protein
MQENPAAEQGEIDLLVQAAHYDLATVQRILGEHPELIGANASWVETPVEAAAQTGNVAIAEYLLGNGADLDICTASMLGMAGKVSEMLEADPSLAHATGAHGIPVLYFPVIHGHVEIANLLLNKGADINAGAGGNTPLHAAAAFGQTGMASWLLANGADRRALDYAGKTALEVAEQRGHEETARVLRAGL